MKITIRGYITHKEAEHYSDCADRYAVKTENNRFAIADGVSRSFFPDLWADILVNNFVSTDKDNQFFIRECQAEWLKQVAEKVQQLDVKWYTKNAFVRNESGLATFVTLRFENMKWVAHALGDSFLFFVPKENAGFDNWVKLSSKPEPVVFDSFPDYYSSRNKEHGEEKSIEEDLKAGTFYLMTDALSEWVFKEKEKAIYEIKKWNSQAQFEQSLTEFRSRSYLNNDDSAILIIELEDDGKTELTYDKAEIQGIYELVEKEKNEIAKQETVEEKKESFVEVKVKSENEKLKEQLQAQENPTQKNDKKKVQKIIERLQNAIKTVLKRRQRKNH
jgi:hypothetical protein